MTTRRAFLQAAGLAGGAVAATLVNRVALAALPEPVVQTEPATMPPLSPPAGRPYCVALILARGIGIGQGSTIR